MLSLLIDLGPRIPRLTRTFLCLPIHDKVLGIISQGHAIIIPLVSMSLLSTLYVRNGQIIDLELCPAQRVFS